MDHIAHIRSSPEYCACRLVRKRSTMLELQVSQEPCARQAAQQHVADTVWPSAVRNRISSVVAHFHSWDDTKHKLCTASAMRQSKERTKSLTSCITAPSSGAVAKFNLASMCCRWRVDVRMAPGRRIPVYHEGSWTKAECRSRDRSNTGG